MPPTWSMIALLVLLMTLFVVLAGWAVILIATRPRQISQLEDPMKCSKCGTNLYSGAAWCSACGEAVKRPKAEDRADPKPGGNLALAVLVIVFAAVLAGYMPWIIRMVHP